MLNSHETDTEPLLAQKSSAVGGNRVTPEELSQALAAIEARKQQEAGRLAGTIPIDDAVSELHLDSTPDEIWTEVQAQREKQAAALEQAAARSDAARREQERRMQDARHTKPRSEAVMPQRGRRRGWPRLIGPAIAFWVLYQTGVIPHAWFTPAHTSAPVIRSLAQIPDGKEVYGDTAALTQISDGKPLTQIRVDENQSADNRWKLVKMGGHIYLRAYVAANDPLQLIPGKALNVFNDSNSGELTGIETAIVTVRVDKIPMQKSGGNDEYSEMTLPNFQPDSLTTINPWH